MRRKKELRRHQNMAKYVIQAKRGAPPGGAYSQGWRAGDFVFVSGTGPIDPVHGGLVGDSIEQQTEQTLDNLMAILEADGASFRDVVKVNVHLSDTSLFARYNAVYARRFSPPYPARTTVGSDLGQTPGMLIEIDCVAYSGKKTGPRPVPGAKKKNTKKKASRRHK
jgi:2-iminobutanoate/2-iminopropanoate deaminase